MLFCILAVLVITDLLVYLHGISLLWLYSPWD
jgi:hypothetical protein